MADIVADGSGGDLPALETRPTLANQAFEVLRAAILEGTLAPGEEVTERKVARQLGVSATPVREAFRSLEHVGLLERTGRSLVVSRLLETPPDELLRIEASLRGLAARLAAEKASQENDAERRIREAVDRLAEASRLGDYESGLEASREFHDTMNRESKNPLLIQFLHSTYFLKRHLKLTKLPTEMSPEDIESRMHEHIAIAEAIIAGDSAAAERLASEHTLTSRVAVIQPEDE
jgi:DNA-binding GntR family transcriptional regulator